MYFDIIFILIWFRRETTLDSPPWQVLILKLSQGIFVGFGHQVDHQRSLLSRKNITWNTCKRTLVHVGQTPYCPRHQPSYSQMMIGVANHLLTIVYRFRYHSQEVFGSLGLEEEPKWTCSAKCSPILASISHIFPCNVVEHLGMYTVLS